MARAVSFAGTAGVIGALVFRRFAAPPEGGVSAAVATRAGFWSALVVLVAVPCRIVVQAQGLAFEGDPWTPMLPRVFATDWGRAAIWQGAGALIAAWGFRGAGRGLAQGWTHVAVAAGILAIAPAFMGHAAAIESGRAVAVAADVAHVAAGGGWAGGVMIVSLVAFRLRDDPAGGEALGALIERFHRVARACVAVVVITGLISTLSHLRSPDDLVGSSYGLALVQKLVLVTVALMLGWGHSRAGARRARALGARGVTSTLGIEWAVLVAVLLVTGLLTGSPPPGAD